MQNWFSLHIATKQEFNLVDCCMILWNFGFSFWYFALLQCFFNVVLCCCSDVALQWYGTAMLKCCCAKVLQSIGVILNWCCSCSELVLKWIGAAVNWCCSAWVLQCIGAAVIWYCNACLNFVKFCLRFQTQSELVSCFCCVADWNVDLPFTRLDHRSEELS